MPAEPHVALVGDSIFDNAAYTRGEPAVIDHLRAMLPAPWRATLCAVDGATTRSVAEQVRRVPRDTTHIVVAIGGNDALGNIDLLNRPVASTAEALQLFRARLDDFAGSYTRALDTILRLGYATTVCTIYNGNLEADTAAIATVALMTFDGVIVDAAVSRGVDVIELRHVCDRPEDYANPIEPSGAGGRRIAAAIARAVGAVEGGGRVCRVFGRGA